MNAPDDLARVLAGTGPILLDFDGPICNVFAGNPAADVADELRQALIEHDVRLPLAVAEEPDPLTILSWTAGLGQPKLTRIIEDVLCAAELRAVATAEPTP